ncbi:MAG: hypothetical protein FIA99_05525 [Ruminiclostridium sp.]|nr:hypothetical protein [Ruminiclostridium sp.]
MTINSSLIDNKDYRQAYDRLSEAHNKLADMLIGFGVKFKQFKKAFCELENAAVDYGTTKTSLEVSTWVTTETGRREECLMLSEALLDAEVKIGDLTKVIPKGSGGDRRSQNFKIDTTVEFEKPKSQVIQELGFSQKQVERFETLADNKDLVEQVKAEARENDDIPTRTRVLDLAQQRKKKEEG